MNPILDGFALRMRALIASLAVLLSLAACNPNWQPVHTGLPAGALSVWGTSARDVYVVGGDLGGGRGPMVLHFDGTEWTRLSTGQDTGNLWWVYGVAPDAVFMVGSGGMVLRYRPDTGRFERMATPGAETLFGVWGSGPRDVWAVGGNIDGTGTAAGVVWHYDGNAWQNVADLPGGVGTRSALFKVWGRAANDVWVVGEGGVALHWDGAAWSQVATGASGRLFTVHGNSREQVAVGGFAAGTIVQGQGIEWHVAQAEDPPRVNGVFVPESGEPIAVGANGSVLRRRGGVWRTEVVERAAALDFHSVWIDPEGGIWAVGGQVVTAPLSDGIIYHLGATIPGTSIRGL